MVVCVVSRSQSELAIYLLELLCHSLWLFVWVARSLDLWLWHVACSVAWHGMAWRGVAVRGQTWVMLGGKGTSVDGSALDVAGMSTAVRVVSGGCVGCLVG